MGKPKLKQSTITIDTINGQTTTVEGCLELNVFIGTTDVHADFYLMKPGKMITPVILGQPWQRHYNGVPNWKQEGLNFETDEVEFFTPFFNDDTFVNDQQSESESTKEEANTSNYVVEKEEQPPTSKATTKSPQHKQQR